MGPGGSGGVQPLKRLTRPPDSRERPALSVGSPGRMTWEHLARHAWSPPGWGITEGLGRPLINIVPTWFGPVKGASFKMLYRKENYYEKASGAS